MAILANTGRVSIAESLVLRPLHLAWGRGDGAWSTPPADNSEATALTNEIARRIASVKGYVSPATGGEIVLPSGSYTYSATPTNHLYVSTTFDYSEATTETIREIGLFVGTVPVSGLPAGQQYFTPSQVADTGRMLHIDYIEPIVRSSLRRETFDVVITF